MGSDVEVRIEALRRQRLAMLRSVLAADGYGGTVRLDRDGARHVIGISPEAGLETAQLSHAVSHNLHEDEEELIAHARRLAALAGIAGRRAQAIVDAGGVLTDPPAWAFLGNPVARGAYAAMGIDLSDFRPKTTATPSVSSLMGLRIVDFRISVSALRVDIGGGKLSVDADAQTARIRLVGKAWPDTLVDSLTGRPIGDVLGLPGLERGTPAGDAPIRTAWSEMAGVGMTVELALEPMGMVPEGVDTSFLQDWSEGHWR